MEIHLGIIFRIQVIGSTERRQRYRGLMRDFILEKTENVDEMRAHHCDCVGILQRQVSRLSSALARLCLFGCQLTA